MCERMKGGRVRFVVPSRLIVITGPEGSNVAYMACTVTSSNNGGGSQLSNGFSGNKWTFQATREFQPSTRHRRTKTKNGVHRGQNTVQMLVLGVSACSSATEHKYA